MSSKDEASRPLLRAKGFERHDADARRRAWLWARRGAALGITVVLLGVFAALGGASAGWHAVSHVASSSRHALNRAFDPSAVGSSAPRFLAADCTFLQGGPDRFEIGVASPQTAGKPFKATLTAVACDPGGLIFTDTNYSGTKPVIFTGPGYSIQNQAPIYQRGVRFRNGVGTATITVFAPASWTWLRAYEGEISGTTSFVVRAG